MCLPSNQKYDFNIVCTCVCGCVCVHSGRQADGHCARCHSVVGEHVSRAGCSCFLCEGLRLPLLEATAMRASPSTPSCPAPGPQGTHDNITMIQGFTLDFKSFCQGWEQEEVPMTAALAVHPPRRSTRERVPWVDLYLLTHGPPKAKPSSPSASGVGRQTGTQTSGRLPGLNPWLSHSQPCKRVSYATALCLGLLTFRSGAL